ncbi:ORF6N domain-containing protein [Mangrovibacterium diazotrophicum]|uniref:ORF6N domain-containing protein n=1 Tax=Mangrovibacterium diazotrophicum TaxID=1261403 RepID=A0A419WAK4_9BACT|nr:ORF6N domain-containing protein [Mangrovibacterium diazotrophicum]RKD92454.1 ORF6N domain-containing protein [Mangrovibacterium diazotrophicum]
MNQPVVAVEEKIVSKIYLIRNKKVMIDRDLAELYGVETRVLNQAVKRNISRFPDDFMFQLTKAEFENWKSQIVISNSEKMGLRKAPLAFTEQGIAMLSSVLNSDQAIPVNIQIMRIFTKVREMLADTMSLRLEIEEIKKKLSNQDKNIELVFSYLDELISQKENQTERRLIGYQQSGTKK